MIDNEYFLNYIEDYEKNRIGIYKDSVEEPQTVFERAVKEHPAGMAMLFNEIGMMNELFQIYRISLIMAFIIGIAIYLSTNKDNKGVKNVVITYLLSILMLIFIEVMTGDTFTFVDQWMTPMEYIIPITIIYVFVIAVRIIKRKEMAKKLNEKLNQIKEKSE